MVVPFQRRLGTSDICMGDTTVEGRSTPGNLTEVLDVKTRFLGIHLLILVQSGKIGG